MKKVILTILCIVILSTGIVYGLEQNKIHHTPPAGNTITLTVPYGSEPAPEELVTNVTGNEPISLSFVNAPDCSKIGAQKITVMLTDAYGNTTTVTSFLTVTPVIPEVTLEATERALSVKSFLYDASLEA